MFDLSSNSNFESEPNQDMPVVKTTNRKDFSQNFWDSTKETLRVLYSNRDSITGDTTEEINDIIYRVSKSVAIAELKYVLTPQEIVWMDFETAANHPIVDEYTDKFATAIGNQFFWANTPANINADPETALKVLKYWAHGKLAGFSEAEIWLNSEELIETRSTDKNLHMMGVLAKELKGKGCLAACGVAFVTDSLEGIQEAARMETLATKAAMGMGLNTSKLRPWGTIVANGAAASGPDRFYEKSISKAVEAVAQGGRRGGALIELRNTDHPDILIFIDKKKLTPPPSLGLIFKQICEANPIQINESDSKYKADKLLMAEKAYGEAYSKYLHQQSYLKNTNITVLCMPGFMEAVENKQWYQCNFAGKPWEGKVYDPRKQLAGINPLTKENFYEEYSVKTTKYPEASIDSDVDVLLDDQNQYTGYVRKTGCLYAPEVFDRIIEGMRDSGEPGIGFYETINGANANDHIYDLDTCNPCGEQFLPAGLGKDGLTYMGNCNLSSLHAAHQAFFFEDGTYDYAAMKEMVKLQQRFMDNVTDVSWYPITLQNMTARMERRNGGGFAGIAEYLSKLGVGFGTEEGLEATKKLFEEYTDASVEASKQLATDRGTYPLWKGSQFEKLNLKVRNSCMTNNAPTGTLAQAMQTSWGIDPHNGIVFSRKVRSRFVDFVAPGFKEAMEAEGAWPQTEEAVADLIKSIRNNNKSVQGLVAVPESVQKAFPIRVEITPDQYIKHLAAIHDGVQKYPHSFNSVSNTCSIPLGFDMEEVKQATILAWKLGVKDITFYPDGSRLSQPVEQIASEGYEKSTDLVGLLGVTQKRKVNFDETYGTTYKVKVGAPDGQATMHVSLNASIDKPTELIEAYFRVGKSGALDSGYCEAIGRLCSAFLQYSSQFGSDERSKVEDIIVKQLINISSNDQTFYKFPGTEKPVLIQSPCDGLAKAILHYRKSVKAIKRSLAADLPITNKEHTQTLAPLCTKCNEGSMVKIDGCINCDLCGYSKC